MFGEVPEPARGDVAQQQVLQFSLGIGQKSQKWDECDENLKSFAHMAVAALVGCSWCLDFGYFLAHNEGLDQAKAREVPRWRESDVFTPLERDVMEYAEAMSADAADGHRRAVRPAARAARRAGAGGADRLGRAGEPVHPRATPRSASSRRGSRPRAGCSRWRSRAAYASPA